MDRGFAADIAAGAGPVLDHDLLAEPLRQPLADQARGDVDRAAGRKWCDQLHRPRRIRLRSCDLRQYRQSSGTSGQVQKATA